MVVFRFKIVNLTSIVSLYATVMEVASFVYIANTYSLLSHNSYTNAAAAADIFLSSSSSNFNSGD